MKAVLLGRVSTGDKDQDPENQLGPLREQASRAGWIVVKELSLEVSAWDEKTAASVWRACLDAIEGGADLLAVWSWDRLSRRGIQDAFHKIGLLEDHYHAGFFSLKEPQLSSGADPQTRELLLSLMAWNARWESEHRSDRLKAAYAAHVRNAANAGRAVRATWGRGRVVSQADVEAVRALRAQGRPIRAIAAELGLPKTQVGEIVKSGLSVRTRTDRDGQCGETAPINE